MKRTILSVLLFFFFFSLYREEYFLFSGENEYTDYDNSILKSNYFIRYDDEIKMICLYIISPRFRQGEEKIPNL